MTAVKVTSTLRADDVKRALRGLPAKVQERVLRKGMRRGMKPMQDALRRAWTAAPYKGKPTHRKAIAAATLVDARRSGRGTEIVGRTGVMYGRKGGARAKGRQRVWHLLENGFRRFVGSNAYRPYSAAASADRDGYRKFVRENRKSIMSEGLPKGMRSDALRAMHADARTKFQAYTGERESRRKQRRSSSATVVQGSHRSMIVVRSRMRETLQRVREEIIAAARDALRGVRRGNR